MSRSRCRSRGASKPGPLPLVGAASSAALSPSRPDPVPLFLNARLVSSASPRQRRCPLLRTSPEGAPEPLPRSLSPSPVPDVGTPACVRRDLEERVRETLIRTVPELLATKYNLLANICHDSPPGQGKEGQTDPLSAGCYRVHVQNKATEQW